MKKGAPISEVMAPIGRINGGIIIDEAMSVNSNVKAPIMPPKIITCLFLLPSKILAK